MPKKVTFCSNVDQSPLKGQFISLKTTKNIKMMKEKKKTKERKKKNGKIVQEGGRWQMQRRLRADVRLSKDKHFIGN